METLFGPDFFRGNREKLRRLFTGTAPIVLTAHGQIQRNSDTALTFRQDSNFWYLTGLNEADVILVMDKDKEYLILPERNDYQNIFDGEISGALLAKSSGIESVMNNKDGWKKLKSRLTKVKHVATIAPSPAYIASHGFYANPARAELVNRIKELTPNIEFLDLRSHLAHLRSIKQPVELEAIQKAISITASTLKQVSRKLASYNYEYEIEADLSLGFRKRGAVGHSYAPIVADGPHACTLHYVANDGRLNPKDLVLIDAGAEVSNYASDISRTYAKNVPTKRQRTVYEVVLEVQEFAMNILKPGILMRNYEQEVENFMGEKLRALGLIKTISHENVRHYYPHSTSHFLGLDVHDVGDYSKPLEENMVLTVEPGIYIPEEGLGIRVEDDVMVSSKGVKNLSQTLPRLLS